MTLAEVEKKFEAFRNQVTRLCALRQEKEETLESRRGEYKVTEKEIDILSNVRVLLEGCNIASREFVKTEVEQLVTQGLRAILSDPLIKFNIEFVEKRNQTEAVFYLTTEGDDTPVEGDIPFVHGGGIVDIISISLRVIMMQLLKLEGPLILDEPGKNISAQYIDKFGKFLVDISKAFDRQIVMITHNTTLASCANTTVSVEQKSGISRVDIQRRG